MAPDSSAISPRTASTRRASLRALLLTPCAALGATAAASATDLELRVESAGQPVVVASPGAQVGFDVIAELSDAASDGLAGFRFDLTFTGGALIQLTPPAIGPMLQFQSPTGLANPAGYGGTVVGGDLIQVGGAQNTIANFFAPQPTGSVLTGVAQFGSPELIATGQLTAPTQPGVYLVRVQDADANVLLPGQSGFPFWEVERAPAAPAVDLTVIVPGTLTADLGIVSVADGGTQTLSLDAGPANAGRVYLMLGSVTGDSPPIPLPPVSVPIVFDAYTNYTLTKPNSALLANSLSALDGLGTNQASFVLPAGASPTLAGTVVYHAYLLVTPAIDFASNSVQLYLVP